MKPAKTIVLKLQPEHADIFSREANKIDLATSPFIRMILIQWLQDTGKLDHMGKIETQISEAQAPEEYRL